MLAFIRADAARLESDPSALAEIVRHYVQSVTVYDAYIDIVYAINPKNNMTPAIAGGCNMGELPR